MFLLKVSLGGLAAIAVVALVFFNFYNLATWMELNSPFQAPWVAVQLSNSEVLYGHLSGVSDSIVGLRDVYLLDTFTPAAAIATSTDLAIGTKYVPVPDAASLFLNRSAVLYFKFLTSDDPAMPYLK